MVHSRSACIAGGLIEAVMTPVRRYSVTPRVPPVLQAASLKRTSHVFVETPPSSRSACIAGGLIEARLGRYLTVGGAKAFRLYCRRPH